MVAKVLVDGRVRVSTGQTYVLSADVPVAWTEAFAGQTNGMLGAARAGLLTVGTGVREGYIGLRVLLYDEAPPVGDGWEDVVEVSCRPSSADLEISDIDSGEYEGFSLEHVEDYRVRLSVRGMDAGVFAMVVTDEDELVEHHELAFWPAAAAPDAVLRVGSECAGLLHQDVGR